jgi:hypothetical protein
LSTGKICPGSGLGVSSPGNFLAELIVELTGPCDCWFKVVVRLSGEVPGLFVPEFEVMQAATDTVRTIRIQNPAKMHFFPVCHNPNRFISHVLVI